VAISRYDRCQCHYERRCRFDDGRWCLGTIGVDEVAAAVRARLEAARATP
jgi:hypothetical protein